MIRKLLRSINDFYITDYVPRVAHIIYPVSMMFIGYTSIVNYGWLMFGQVLFWLGVALAVVIIVGIGWRGPIEYWKQIEETIHVMLKIKDPAVWVSLGYKKLPEQITIEEKRFDDYGEYQGSTFKKTSDIPVTVANQLANRALMNLNEKDVDFTLDKYKASRKTQEKLKELGYIVPKNKKNVRNGYRWSKKGIDFCYQYADNILIETLRKEVKDAS